MKAEKLLWHTGHLIFLLLSLVDESVISNQFGLQNSCVDRRLLADSRRLPSLKQGGSGWYAIHQSWVSLYFRTRTRHEDEFLKRSLNFLHKISHSRNSETRKPRYKSVTDMQVFTKVISRTDEVTTTICSRQSDTRCNSLSYDTSFETSAQLIQ